MLMGAFAEHPQFSLKNRVKNSCHLDTWMAAGGRSLLEAFELPPVIVDVSDNVGLLLASQKQSRKIFLS